MAQSRGSLIAKIVGGGLLGLLVLAAATLYYADHLYKQPGPLGHEVNVVIVPGMGVRRVSHLLEYAGAVDRAQFFELAVRIKGGPLQAGEYRIPPGASMADILALLRSGEVVVHKLTIPEGVTSQGALALLNRADVMTGTLDEAPPEGALLPDTYHYTWGVARDDMVARMQEEMQKALTAAWADRAPGLPFDTPEEALVLASIIEKETAVSEERPLIAGVFVNRLKKGMRLQSDPTVIYGIVKGDEMDRALSTADLETPTAYNTYRIAGLPPTPIANPGRASIEAALNPADTDALYFVADGSGGHAFAETYEEHLENVRRWRERNR